MLQIRRSGCGMENRWWCLYPIISVLQLLQWGSTAHREAKRKVQQRAELAYAEHYSEWGGEICMV